MVAAIPLRGDAVAASALWRRVASAVVLIPVVVWLTAFAPAPLFHALVIPMAAAAAWELGRMFERAGRATHRWLDPLLTAVVVASFLLPGFRSGLPDGPVAALTTVMSSSWMLRLTSSLNRTSTSWNGALR